MHGVTEHESNLYSDSTCIGRQLLRRPHPGELAIWRWGRRGVEVEVVYHHVCVCVHALLHDKSIPNRPRRSTRGAWGVVCVQPATCWLLQKIPSEVSMSIAQTMACILFYFIELYFYNTSKGCFIWKKPSLDISCCSIYVLPSILTAFLPSSGNQKEPRVPERDKKVMHQSSAKPRTWRAGNIWRRAHSDSMILCLAEATVPLNSSPKTTQ